jgi:hypothetical protein
LGRLDGPAADRSPIGGNPAGMPHAPAEPPAKVSAEGRTVSVTAKPPRLTYPAYGEEVGRSSPAKDPRAQARR